jgi:DNA-binding winged helix-turn-helix (wHTH) protein/tetratricopeptide (TPR) repeat protein/TolB-like protein
MNTSENSKRNYRFGLFEADPAKGELLRQGVRIRLQDQPFRLLVILLERAGEVVTREELRQKLWSSDTYVEFDGSLGAALKRLRFALGDSADNPIFIETLSRRGYRFIAPVAVQDLVPELHPEVVAMVPATPATAPAAPAPSLVHLRAILIYVAGLIVLFAALGWHLLRRRSTVNSKPTNLAQVIAVRKSIAVLGFHNVSGRSDDQWLATALSEMLSTELASGDKLRLVPGEEVANLRISSPWPQTSTLGPETTARIGTALNSDVLVYGAYTAIGSLDRGQLRLDVRLQDARTGEVLTQVAQTSSSNDLFRVATEIGAKLRDRLGVPGISDADQASVLASLPLNREAARFYALGIEKLREFDALAAKDLLEQATKADPKFSLAHAMLARAWNQLGYEQKRKEEAKKALDLFVDLPQVDRMQVEGDYYESLPDHEKAASSYRALFALFPDNIEYGLQLADAQRAAGHNNQSLETLAQLRRLPPPGSLDPRIDIAEAAIAPTPAEALVLLDSALSKASTQGKKLVYARVRIQQCRAFIYGEHPEKSEAPCEDAYNIYRAAGNDLGAADALRLMGDRQGAEGHLQEAQADYQRALKMLTGTGEHLKTATILNNMAIGFANGGNLERGEQLYRQAKLNFELGGDKVNAGLALANIADISYFQGNLPAAAKGYEQAYEIMASVDNADVRYPLNRLADTNLVQGNVKEAHHFAAQSVDISRTRHADSDEAMSELGDVLAAEGDLPGARQQYQAALDIRQARGKAGMAADSRLSLADVALEENHPDQAETLVRTAIAEYEKEQSNPAAASAYTELSRALLQQGKLEDARQAIQHATELSHGTHDPTLKLPLAIQYSRVRMAEVGENSQGRVPLRAAIQQLRSVIALAKKLHYYEIECEGRLALAEAEWKTDAAASRSQMEVLQKETHEHGLELLSHKAHLLAARQPSLSSH